VRRLGARARWAIPVGAVATVGVIVGATAVASAAQPSLPARSVAQLLADVQQAAARPQGPLTATIQETANLGLPALPQVGALGNQSGAPGALTPLAGTTTINLWYLNPQHVRVAQQTQMGESDVRLDGNQLWLWNSKSQMATHVLLPRSTGHQPGPAGQSSMLSGRKVALSESPLAAARQALAAIGPSTSVRLGPNVSVAGRAAYQISIAPKGSGSLVSQILIAIDASRHIPLRVEVLARGSSSPALELGFTALTFGPPAQSNFSFTPPPGAKVKTVTVPDKAPAGLAKRGLAGLGLNGFGPGLGGIAGLGLGGPGGPLIDGGPASFGPGPLQPPLAHAPVLPKVALKQIAASFAAHLPKNLTKAQRAAAIKSFDKQFAAGMKANPANGGGFVNISPLHPRAKLVKGHLVLIAPTGRVIVSCKVPPTAKCAKLAKGQSMGFAPLTGRPIPSFGAAGSPKVLGKDWTSVIATPASPAVAAAVQQLLAARHPGHAKGFAVLGGSSSQAAPAPGNPGGRFSPGRVPIGPDLAVLRALLMATTPVHGAWGSGRLLQSALLSVLVTSKGQILAGAVTPSVLYADAAALSK
jgi:outer membrane lipoprotein-sorting protein